MKTFLISVLWRVITRLIGDKSLIEMIGILVKEAARLDISGKQKKAKVDASLENLKGRLGDIYKETSGWLINSAIEAAVGKLKEKGV